MKLHLTTIALGCLLLLPSCAGTPWADPATWLGLGIDAIECAGELDKDSSRDEQLDAAKCLLTRGAEGLEAAPVIDDDRATEIVEAAVPCARATEAYLADPENKALEVEAKRASEQLERVKSGKAPEADE